MLGEDGSGFPAGNAACGAAAFIDPADSTLIDYSHAWVHDPTAATFEELDARLRSEPYLKQCRVALVNPPEFHAAPTESIGRDFGYPVRRFNSRRAAIAWLCSNEAAYITGSLLDVSGGR